MTPTGLLSTALLLGLYVLLAGGYGLVYTLARLERWRNLKSVAGVFFVLHCAIAVLIVVSSALAPGWKLLLVASSVAIFVIPPLTWRYLEHIHGGEGTQ
jgi:hypothetical protein